MFISPVLANSSKAPEFLAGTIRVSAEEAAYLQKRKQSLLILDTRKQVERNRTGWIDGSVALPGSKLNANMLAELTTSKETPLLFYCHGERCRQSMYAARLALKLGYKEIYWLRGGIEEWLNKQLPVVF